MNHIHRLTAERDEARAVISSTAEELHELVAYLTSPKFSWPDGDYVHIRTDLMPKLIALRNTLTG